MRYGALFDGYTEAARRAIFFAPMTNLGRYRALTQWRFWKHV